MWVSSRSYINKVIDRIERSMLKNYNVEGGLNITDVECLNKSLKHFENLLELMDLKDLLKMIQRYLQQYHTTGI
jgi:hypothetical protein